ncbi:unnamed protein product [Effrenium voratum]|nr:unnamed protein product [Effrenium voratum]
MTEMASDARPMLCFSQLWTFEQEERRRSLWPFATCDCSTAEVTSPPPSPGKRGTRLPTPTLLAARAREAANSKATTVEVVRVATMDECSEMGQKSSSSSLPNPGLVCEGLVQPSIMVTEADVDLKARKQNVRWQAAEDDVRMSPTKSEPKSEPKSGKSSPAKAARSQKKRKTLHTWLSAMLDVSEGGLDAGGVEPGSPSSYARSRSRNLLPPSPNAGISPSSKSARSRGWRTPVSSAPSSPARSVGSPTGASAPSILSHLREHFANNIDADGSGHLSREDLFEHIKELLEKESGPLSRADIELLSEVENCRFSEMELHLGGEGLGMAEWLHFMLLRASAPSHVASKHLNRHLRKALEDDLELLGRIHAAFEYADTEGDGLLRQEKWPEAFEVVGLSQPPEEVLEDREEDGSPWALSYYEFVAHALGLKASVVELALYDLSQGVAQWIPASLLGGHKLGGVWHSGLRVFGKEFWFGGVILESNYSDVPFGSPAKVIRLGTTLRTYEDLVEFLKEDVYVDYNPRMYDVLRRNCNHFSNELAQFLLHGKQLPEDVIMQPEWVKDAALVRTMRPVLNRWLGGFGDALSNAEAGEESTPQAVSRIDDLTEEWRSRLQAGDLVMHRTRFIDRPRAVRIMAIYTNENGARVAEMKFFKPVATESFSIGTGAELPPFSWEVVRQQNVPLRQFYPLLEEEHGSAHILRAGLAIRDEGARQVLQRPRSIPVPAQCTKGHVLKPAEARWWFTACCSVCAGAAGSGASACTQCDFNLCQSCREAAGRLPGSGAFSDVLSAELAKALLDNQEWLTYKAQVFFVKADHNSAGVLDKPKARRVDNRLAAELGVKPLTDAELVKEIKDLGGELGSGAFRRFFEASLRRSLQRLEQGKQWRPKRRASRQSR